MFCSTVGQCQEKQKSLQSNKKLLIWPDGWLFTCVEKKKAYLWLQSLSTIAASLGRVGNHNDVDVKTPVSYPVNVNLDHVHLPDMSKWTLQTCRSNTGELAPCLIKCTCWSPPPLYSRANKIEDRLKKKKNCTIFLQLLSSLSGLCVNNTQWHKQNYLLAVQDRVLNF